MLKTKCLFDCIFVNGCIMRTLIIFNLIVISAVISNVLKGQDNKFYNVLSLTEKYVIGEKGTEKPFTGKYTDHKVRWNICMQTVWISTL